MILEESMDRYGRQYEAHTIEIHTQTKEAHGDSRKLIGRGLFWFFLIIAWVLFKMVLRTRGGGYHSGSGVGIDPMDEYMWEFTLLEITRGILEKTHVMFGTIKEWIMEIMHECLGALRSEIAAGQSRARALSHREFKVCESLDFFGEEDTIASSLSERSKVGYTSDIQGDRLCDQIFIEVL